MNRDQIIEFLHAIGVKPKGFARGYVNVSCPLAPWRHQNGTDRSPSFGIRESSHGESRCHCLSCSFTGAQSELLVVLASRGYSAEYEKAWSLIQKSEAGSPLSLPQSVAQGATKPVIPFPESFLHPYPPAWGIRYSRRFLESRGVSEQVCNQLDFRWDHARRRVGVPVRDETGALCGFHGRTVAEADPPYLMYSYGNVTNPQVWLGESWISYAKVLVFTESVFDLTAVYRWYENVACPLAAGFGRDKLRRVAKADRIVTFFDADKPGDAARDVVEGLVGSTTWVTHLYPTGGAKDPGDMYPEAVAEALANAGIHLTNGT